VKKIALYSSPNIIWEIKLRLRWAEHVARLGRGVHAGFWWGNLREIDHLEDPGTEGRIELRCIFRKWDVRAWIGLMWLRIGTGGGHLYMQ
jgi:hypothetical protein